MKIARVLDQRHVATHTIPRAKLMSVRRMLAAGKSAEEVMEAIAFTGSVSAFRRQCQKYQIRLGRKPYEETYED